MQRSTLFSRFLASELLRDYWLSGPYGRNWAFLWSAPIPKYQTLLLILLFFVVIWGVVLWTLTHFSMTHTWLLPVFAVGLGAPRWCQVRTGTCLPGITDGLRADAVGYFIVGFIYPMGWIGRSLPRHFSMVMAWSFRRRSRRWIGHDTAAGKN